MKFILGSTFDKVKVIGVSIFVGSTPVIYALDQIQDQLRPLHYPAENPSLRRSG